MPKKIVTVIGARPQFVKAAIVSRKISQSTNLEEVLVHTGQHYDKNMSDLFFDEMEISKPKYNLEIGSGPHGKQTGKMLEKIEEVLLAEKPDILMTYGDTNSTIAGSLAAAKLHVSVAHVEAGLRSFNKKMPEEVNRILTDHISDYLFTPTDLATTLLTKEGLPTGKIFQVGDVMYDVSLFFAEKAQKQSKILQQLELSPNNYVLSTIHRAENTDDSNRLKNIFTALNDLNNTCQVILPIHPRTKKILSDNPEIQKMTENLTLIEPVGFLDMIVLEKNAKMIATDSGGVQKEAFFFDVPCVTLRDETEWMETIELNWNKLASPSLTPSELVTILIDGLERKGHEGTPYGKGDASSKICKILSSN